MTQQSKRSNKSIAFGKVRRAIDRLARQHPLTAGILAKWDIVESESTRTMSVGLVRSRLTLKFGSAFVDTITTDELCGVLQHEANHVLFGHVFHEPQPNEDRWARTVAEEVTVNEWVDWPLPLSPIVLADYPQLPPLESTEERYDRLKRPRKPPDDAEVPTLDEHDWQELEDAPGWVIESIARVIERTVSELSPEEARKSRRILEAVKQVGILSGQFACRIQSGAANVPWQRVLRCFVGQAVERRPVFGRPPRRFPHLVGQAPSRGRRTGKPKVMAVIDTSCSMTDALLADISAELGVMARTHEVTVVECDSKIHRVYPFRPIEEVCGRGGTDFRPPFEPEFLATHKPDLIVYFTDGYGTAPSPAPLTPVIWCITEGGKKPASWGRNIRL